MFQLKGVYAPIPTPFTDAFGPIDYSALEENFAFWNGSRLTGIVVMGSNGEFDALDFEERKEIITQCCRFAEGKKSIIAGCGCENTRDTIKLCEHAAKAGADAALVISPNYYKKLMDEKTNEQFYKDVADASPIPVILYNMPGNSGINLSSALDARLSQYPNIIGVKDSGGNIVQISEIIRDAKEGFSVFAGSASFLLTTLVMGGKGGTLALANVMPNECAELYDLYMAGKMEEAVKLQLRLIAPNAAITTRFGIPGLKAAMELIGLKGGLPRRPMLPTAQENVAVIRDIFEKAGAKLA